MNPLIKIDQNKLRVLQDFMREYDVAEIEMLSLKTISELQDLIKQADQYVKDYKTSRIQEIKRYE